MEPENDALFLPMFKRGDLPSARSWIGGRPAIAGYGGYQAHPLLREFVQQNGGHCYKTNHRAIADLLIPMCVRAFRDAVFADRIEDVQGCLDDDPKLVHAEFTGGRGIAQAIHHWRTVPVGRLLLDCGANINALTTVGCAGETPLMMQLRFGTLEGARFLLDRGADPNLGGLKHVPGKTMMAGLELLLQHGWNINEQVGGRTLLHHDANHGHGRRIRLLLDLGADPNIEDCVGRTVLHLVSARGAGSESIRALAAAGANLNARDHAGKTPLDLGVAAKIKSAGRVLQDLGAKGS